MRHKLILEMLNTPDGPRIPTICDLWTFMMQVDEAVESWRGSDGEPRAGGRLEEEKEEDTNKIIPRPMPRVRSPTDRPPVTRMPARIACQN
ncbi:hypothetical protein Trydic_g21139 [Trypoxylus dichotomus]